MKAQDLQAKSVEELNVDLQKALAGQFKLRIQKATGQLAQTHLLKSVRRDVARIKTALNQKAGN